VTLKGRNFCFRYGPDVRSQWRILPRDRLFQITYFRMHRGDFFVDVTGNGASLLVWILTREMVCLSKTSKRKACSFHLSDRRDLPAKL